MKLIFTLLLLNLSLGFAQSNCNEIHITTDNRTGSTKYESPLTFDMQHSKTITKTGDTVYNLFLQMFVNYTNPGEKGCIVYLSDGSTLQFPEQQVTVSDMSLFRFKYSTTLTLSASDISRLLQFDIVDFRLHIHNCPESKILAKKKNAKIMSDYLKCIVKGSNK